MNVTLRAETRLRVRHLRRGRPRQSDPVREERRTFYRLEFAGDEEVLRRQARTDGVFPLVTNLPPRPYPKKDVLLIYQYQPYVGQRRAVLKSEVEGVPVYLTPAHRAAVLVAPPFRPMRSSGFIRR